MSDPGLHAAVRSPREEYPTAEAEACDGLVMGFKFEDAISLAPTERSSGSDERILVLDGSPRRRTPVLLPRAQDDLRKIVNGDGFAASLRGVSKHLQPGTVSAE